jgi:hypothetical protein
MQKIYSNMRFEVLMSVTVNNSLLGAAMLCSPIESLGLSEEPVASIFRGDCVFFSKNTYMFFLTNL